MPSQIPEFIGRYQVVKELKSGGMGTVFLGRDPRIGRHMGGRFVAIKVLQEFEDHELRARFEREADIAGTLDHRNIVQIYDRDEYDGRPFIVMEFVDGRTLSDLIEAGSAPLSRKLQWMDELCDGLACAHKAGVVHRDIKPANVMIRTQDGVLKILDFGIARATTIQVGTMKTRGIMGTLNYMAPEQWEATSSVDARADIFASGAVFYELLSGRKAFPGSDVPTIYRQIAMLDPEPLEARSPHLDAELIAIVNRCLAKRPADRYPDMDAVRTDLAAYRRQLSSRDATVLQMRPARHLLDEAQQALESGDFTRALRASEQALAAEPDNTAARDVAERARAALDLQEGLQEARAALDRGDLEAALARVDRILAANPSHPEALTLRLEVQALRDRRELTRRLEAALARGHAALEAGRLDDASQAASDASALGPGHAEVARLQQAIAAARDARRQQEEEIRRRQQEAARRRAEEAARLEAERRAAEQRAQAAADMQARAVVTDARRRFSSGDYQQALDLLARYQPPHPEVAAARAELAGELAAIEKQRAAAERRLQEEERQREERERIRLEDRRAGQTIAEARRRIALGDRTGALALLEAHQPPHAEVSSVLAALRREIARVEEEERRAEAARREGEPRERAGADRIEAEPRRGLAAPVPGDRDRLAPGAAVRRANEAARRGPGAGPSPTAPPAGRPAADRLPEGAAAHAAPSAEVSAPRGRDWRPIAAAAVVMLVAGAGALFWRSSRGSSGQASIADSAPRSTPAPPPSSASAAGQTPGGTDRATGAGPAAPPAGHEAGGRPDARLAALRADAEQQWKGGERDRAIAALAAALAIRPDDPEATALARAFVREASGRTARAADEARDIGASVAPGSVFAEGRRRQQEADALDRAGRYVDTLRAYNEAMALFAKAAAAGTAPLRGGSAPPSTVARVASPTVESQTTAPVQTARGSVPAAPPAAVPSPPPAQPPAQPPPNAATAATVSAAQQALQRPESGTRDRAADLAAIQQALQRYRAGYESLNAAAVKAVYPAIDARRLAEVFKQYSSLTQSLEIDRIDIAPDGQTATASGAVTNAPVVKAGKADPKRSQAVFRLRRGPEGWLIQDVSLK